MSQQGSWNQWNMPGRKLTWQELWQYEPLQLSFLLKSVYDLLPTPTNLERWKLSEEPSCPLCKQTGTLQHVLTDLSQGRYRWRHDQALRVLADILEKEKRQERQTKTKGPVFINFVKSGQKAKGVKKTGLLQEARHWEMKVDLRQKLVFLNVVQTSLRPEIVIWSTVPKVPITGRRVHGGRILYLGLPCGSRMQGLSCPISLESLGSSMNEGHDKEKCELSVEQLRERPFGSGSDVMKPRGSQHRQAVFDLHCCPAITRVYRDKGRNTCQLMGTRLTMFALSRGSCI